MNYEVVIGLEVHAQLSTKSKMFCSCSAEYQDAAPNTRVCPVCLGMPGVLPVINREAVELVMRTGLALGCTISEETKFDRKNYPYPDLMKGYQISQYDQPIANNGSLMIESNSHERRVGITRVHLEEDVAKLFHRNDGRDEAYSLLDVNRSGVPLMEIVGEPDLRSPDEARSYLTRLRSVVRYIGASTANMEEGSFRCDANISVRPQGSSELGAKVEVKNMNSFRAVHRALQFEAERQLRASMEGQRIVQETRGWVEESGVTVSQRTKEYASDYRYFPEPDLPPMVMNAKLVQQIRESLPELPQARQARFVEQYGLPEYDAGLLTASKADADFFESVMQLRPLTGESREQLAKSVSNWIQGELWRLLNLKGLEIEKIRFQPQQLLDLLDLVDAGTLNTGMAKTIFEEMFDSGKSPSEIAKEEGMVQISDVEAIRSAVEEAISNNPQPVGDYLRGKDTAMRFLVGQVMKITKGKANPQLASQLLKEVLESVC